MTLSRRRLSVGPEGRSTYAAPGSADSRPRAPPPQIQPCSLYQATVAGTPSATDVFARQQASRSAAAGEQVQPRGTTSFILSRVSMPGAPVTCDSPTCMSRAASEAEALDKIKREIRYRIEWCPCTGVEDDYVQLQVER